MADHALAEQLEGLLNLLKAVGIDSVDNREIKRASIALKNQGSGAPIVFPGDDPEAKQLNDDQIEAMILKLQQAQAQAPQLMEALEEYVDQRHGGTSSRGTKKKVKKKKGKTTKAEVKQTKQQHRNQHQQFQQQQQQRHQQYDDEEEEEEEEYIEEVIDDPEPPKNDHDDYDEEEEEDDFDEDADYPMVGPGVSDDVSVVSDMTTPTVVSSIHVNDEEQYQDMLPSMYLSRDGGPPMMIQPPKRRNLVSQVGAPNRGGPGAGVPMRVGPAAPAAGMGLSASHHSAAGGAAAKRRQTYQQTMSKLHQNPYGTVTAGPPVNPNAVPVVAGEHAERHLPPRSRSGDGGLIMRPAAPGRTRSGSADGGQPLTSNSYHGGDFSFDVSPEGWNPFGDINAPQESPSLDESGRGSTSGKPKKKTTKTAKVATKAKASSVAAPTKSPKAAKKKKAVGSTTIDKDGFLVGGAGAPLSPQKKTTKKDSDSLSKSQHTTGSKKVVKKKVVKKAESGEGQPKKSPTNKVQREPR
jgi:hypothetical protein